jgi:hypothetical protein
VLSLGALSRLTMRKARSASRRPRWRLIEVLKPWVSLHGLRTMSADPAEADDSHAVRRPDVLSRSMTVGRWRCDRQRSITLTNGAQTKWLAASSERRFQSSYCAANPHRLVMNRAIGG